MGCCRMRHQLKM
ncbi:hypothetical protein LINPERPRIM_LOCUS37608 [Linum perenne]